MKSRPLFSILIALYNRESYVKDSINSALAQDYPNIEIVVLDDKSTDASLDIAKKMSKNDKRIRVYSNKYNKGCGFTKNRCGYLAKGEIMGYLDPDDLLDHLAVSKMVKTHIDNPKVSLIYSRKKYFQNSDTSNLVKTYHQESVPEGFSYLTGKPYIVDHFASFKSSSFRNAGGLNPAYLRAVDQDLYYRMEEVGSLLFLDDYLYKYRIHNQGISTGSNRNKAFYWHITAASDACARRGEDSERIISNLIEFEKSQTSKDLSNQVKYLQDVNNRNELANKDVVNRLTRRINHLQDVSKLYEICEAECQNQINVQESNLKNLNAQLQHALSEFSALRSSKSFRIGRLITYPARMFRK